MRLHRSIFILLSSLVWAVSFLAAGDIIRDYDRSVDFSSLTTYSWLSQEKIPIFRAVKTEVPAEFTDVEADVFIKAKVDDQLKKKGFTKVDSETADFLVSYLAIGKLDLSATYYDAAFTGRTQYGHWRPLYNSGSDSRLQRKGTLTLDILDPETNKLIWRGSATETFDKPKDAFKKSEKAIKDMLKKFPPK